MTLQVAMVGTDGVLLASDTLWSETRQEMISGKAQHSRHTYGRTKIFVDEKRNVAVSFARNMETSRRAAELIASDVREAQWESPETIIEEIAFRAIESLPQNRFDVNCLIVSPNMRVFQLEMEQRFTPEGQQDHPSCCEHTDKAVAGDTFSPALYLMEQYYEPRPIHTLAPLASQIIFAGAKLSPDRIGGLEIVLCDKSGVHRLPVDSIRELQSSAQKQDKRLREALTGRLRNRVLS